MEPLIKIRPPGPNAVAILKRDATVISQSMARQYPLVLQEAQDVNVWDVDGNRYLDFTAGFAVMNVGWNHPEVVHAVEQQAAHLSHAAFLSFCSEMPVAFAERLVDVLPHGLNRVCLTNSGAESIEAAMKLARYHTGRKNYISFYGGFHGRTYGALSLTATKSIYRARFGPFLPVIHAPFPDPYRSSGPESSDADVLRTITEEIFKKEVPPDEVAAIFVEPIQGEGGYIVPPKPFLGELRTLCDEHGILLIVDEVQTGCFRTGTFLALEQFKVRPDIVCLSKAIGGGLPLGVMIASDEVSTWLPGSHASTFAGNNVACAAGLAVLSILNSEGFGDQVMRMGKHLRGRLDELQQDYTLIGHARGMGLMAAIELVRSRATKEPAVEERQAILTDAFENGLALLPAGGSAIRFCPPLTIKQDDIDTAVEILRRALEGAVE